MKHAIWHICMSEKRPFYFQNREFSSLIFRTIRHPKKTQTYSGTHAGTYHQQPQIIQKKVILFLSEEVMKKRNYESRKISTQKRRHM